MSVSASAITPLEELLQREQSKVSSAELHSVSQQHTRLSSDAYLVERARAACVRCLCRLR